MSQQTIEIYKKFWYGGSHAFTCKFWTSPEELDFHKNYPIEESYSCSMIENMTHTKKFGIFHYSCTIIFITVYYYSFLAQAKQILQLRSQLNPRHYEVYQTRISNVPTYLLTLIESCAPYQEYGDMRRGPTNICAWCIGYQFPGVEHHHIHTCRIPQGANGHLVKPQCYLTVRVNRTKREGQRAKLERYYLECVS